jgi:hypothetical protein
MKIIIAFALVAAMPASAAVVSAAPNGFEIKQTVNLVVPPEVAMASFAELPSWWDSEHTYSGDPSNLSLVLRPGGCFCERLPDGGGIEHMRVTFVDPGKRVVLTGSLGPLLYEATSGVMDVQVKRAAGGSQLILDYKVAGFANGGGEAMAAKVDEVLAEQMKRLRAYATSRPTTG